MSELLTTGDMGKALNRPTVYLRGLQGRFELPVLEGAAYSAAYLAFLQGIVCLRTLNIAEEHIRELWVVEKKLLYLLHADSSDSPTWFLDACGQTRHRARRLLLSNYDVGISLRGGALQIGLNFNESSPELFTSAEMGEDALRLLSDYLRLHAQIQRGVTAELPRVQASVRWARRLISVGSSF